MWRRQTPPEAEEINSFMKLKALLTTFAKKSGIDVTTDENKTYFETIPDQDIPDAIATGMDNALISITDAKNNHQDISNHYRAQTLSSVDSSLASLMDEYQVSDAVRAEIQNERSTFKKGPLLIKKLIELEKENHKKNGSSTSQHAQEIDRLQALLNASTQKAAAMETAHQNQLRSIQVRTKMNSLLGRSAVPTIYDNLDDELRFMSLETVINKQLQEDAAKLDLDNSGNLVILKNDGATFYSENHQTVTPKAYVEQTITRNKITATKKPEGNGTTTSQQQPAGASAGGNTNQNAAGAASYNMQRLKEMEASMGQAGLKI